MSPPIEEGVLRLQFDDQWTAVKWDDSAFRKRRGQHGKAADVAAFDGSAPDRSLLLIEIKDYPDHHLAQVPAPDELARICVGKVRDTLAQLLFSAALVGHPDEDEVELLCREFGSTERPLSIVVCVEDANEPALEMLELQDELERAFRWLPARAVSAATVEELNALVDGLRVTRLA